VRRTGGTETSQYPEEKKSTEIPPVAASERGGAQSQHQHYSQENGLERRAIKGDSPVSEVVSVVSSKSRAGHELSCLKRGGPSSKAKYS
jgi:hypothetical protein